MSFVVYFCREEVLFGNNQEKLAALEGTIDKLRWGKITFLNTLFGCMIDILII